MKLLSKTCEYGIRASLFVASLPEGNKYVSIRRISTELGISYYFLTKVLQTLTRHNIMTSYRGPNGGVALARPASDISLGEMVTALEHDGCLDNCVLGLPGCGQRSPCPLHASWQQTREQIKSMFENANLADLGREINKHGLRLTQ